MKRGLLEFVSSKKAQVEKMPEELGFLVLAAVIILISFFIITTIIGALYSDVDNQEAIGSFTALGSSIESLLKSDKNYDYYELPYSLPSGFILVGFDKEWHGDLLDKSTLGYDENTVINKKVESNWCSDMEGIQKPSQCIQGEEVACICLYEDGYGDDFMEDYEDSKDSVFYPCIQFVNKNISISALKDSSTGYLKRNNGLIDGAPKYPAPLPEIPGQQYEFLVGYGSCDTTFGIQNLYVEKYIEEDKTYITIIPITKESKKYIEERKEKLSQDNN